MKTKTKTFDTMLESRRWRESVAQRTAGMSRTELLDFFNSARASTSQRNQMAEENCIVREEPPKP